MLETSSTELILLLREIRDLLVPISGCFEQQFAEVSRDRSNRRIEEMSQLLTDTRREILPLLFDPRHLTQGQIATAVGTSQPTVSRFVKMLVDRGLIERRMDETGTEVFVDKFDLLRLLEVSDDE